MSCVFLCCIISNACLFYNFLTQSHLADACKELLLLLLMIWVSDKGSRSHPLLLLYIYFFTWLPKIAPSEGLGVRFPPGQGQISEQWFVLCRGGTLQWDAGVPPPGECTEVMHQRGEGSKELQQQSWWHSLDSVALQPRWSPGFLGRIQMKTSFFESGKKFVLKSLPY